MTIKEFNRKRGVYRFNLNEFETEFHSHPAVELIISNGNNLNIETLDNKVETTRFAIIDTNIIHKVESDGSKNDIVMIECQSSIVENILNQCNIDFEKGIYTSSDSDLIDKILLSINSLIAKNGLFISNKPRINKCIQYLNSANSEYQKMIGILKTIVNLSESRLSHVFKAEVGISIKKYLIWSKLKRAFELVIKENINMYEASIAVGFYDQAHLSKAFKSMLGITPSAIYNSRMIQDNSQTE